MRPSRMSSTPSTAAPTSKTKKRSIEVVSAADGNLSETKARTTLISQQDTLASLDAQIPHKWTSPLSEATYQRLSYAFPDACDYILELEADRDQQRRNYEAKNTELLRSISVGQELIEQLDAVKSHCASLARERDTLTLRVGQLQREIEHLQSSRADSTEKRNRKDAQQVTELAARLQQEQTTHQGVVETLEKQISEHRTAREALTEEKRSYEKKIFEMEVHHKSLMEKLATYRVELKEASRREASLREELNSDEIRRAEFLSVSDVRAIGVLLRQLREHLASLCASASTEDAPSLGTAGKLASYVPHSVAIASTRFTPKAVGRDARSDTEALFVNRAASPVGKRQTPFRSTAGADGYMPTPRWGSGDRARSRQRHRPTLRREPGGASRVDVASTDASSEAITTRSGNEDDSDTDADDLFPSWLQKRPREGAHRADQERHDALQSMMNLLEEAKSFANGVDQRLQRQALAEEQHAHALANVQSNLETAEKCIKDLEAQVQDGERRLAAAKETQERLEKQLAAEKSHLQQQLTEAEARAAERVREAQRAVQTVQQEAAAEREALVNEVSLEFDRLQAAHNRLEAELAHHQEGARATEARLEGELGKVQQHVSQLTRANALLTEEKTAAVKEVQRHHESLEQLRKAAEERLQAQDGAAQAHLRASVAQHERAAAAQHKECEALKAQLDSLHRKTQEELDAAQAAKLAATKESQQLKAAMATLKRETLPEMTHKLAHLERLLGQRDQEVSQLEDKVEALVEREGQSRTLQSQLEEKLATVTERNADLERLTDSLQSTLRHEREAAEKSQQQAGEAQNARDLREEEHAALQSTVTALRAQVNTLQRQLNERGTSDANARQVLALRLQETQQLLADADARAESEAARAVAAEEKVLVLSESLKASQASASAAEERLRHAQEDAARAEEALQQRLHQLESVCASLRSAASSRDVEQQKVTEEMTALKAGRADAEARVAKREAELASLKKAAVVAQQQQLARLQEACDTVTRDHEAAATVKSRELAEARTLVARLESTLQAREADLRTAAAEVEQLTEDRAVAERALQQRTTEAMEQQQRIDALQKELRETKAAAAERVRRLREASEQETSSLQQRIQELKAAKDANEQRHLTQLQDAEEMTRRTVEQSVREATEAIKQRAARDRRELEAQAREAQSAHEAATKALQMELHTAQAERDRLHDALKSLRADVKAMHTTLQAKEEELRAEAARDLHEREATLRRQHTGAAAALKEQLEALQCRVVELETIRDNQGQELARATQQLREMAQQQRLEAESQEAQLKELLALRKINANLEARLEEVENDRDPLRHQLHSLLSTD